MDHRAAEPSPSSEPAQQDTAVIEWAPFRLASGVDEGRLLEASESLQYLFLSKQVGFLRRDLLRGRSGEWVDVVTWKDRSAAERAMAAAHQSPACHGYFQLMEADGQDPAATVHHFDRVKCYVNDP